MRTPRPGAPLLVVRQHQIIVFVVATLLFRAFHTWRAGRHAVYRPFVVQTFRIGVPVAVDVRQKPPSVVERVIQRARTLRYLGSEVFQISVIHDPIVAQFFGPTRTVPLFPLWREIPAQWYRFTPKFSKIICTNMHIITVTVLKYTIL